MIFYVEGHLCLNGSITVLKWSKSKFSKSFQSFLSRSLLSYMQKWCCAHFVMCILEASNQRQRYWFRNFISWRMHWQVGKLPSRSNSVVHSLIIELSVSIFYFLLIISFHVLILGLGGSSCSYFVKCLYAGDKLYCSSLILVYFLNEPKI